MGVSSSKMRTSNLGADCAKTLEGPPDKIIAFGDLVSMSLILIDGGKTQLKFVEEVINSSNHKDLKIISIVKGSNRMRATETIISKTGVVELDKYSKAFLLLQEIRDESHRFALKAQRRKNRSKITQSELDNIHGVGDILKKRLVAKFKNVKNIKIASEDDLMTVDGINEKIAKKIKSLLNND